MDVPERKRTLPPVYLLGALLVMASLHLVFPILGFIAPAWRWVGFFPLAAGIALNLWADQDLKRHRTTVKPFEESDALVTDGAYRVSRNPMYTGMVLILAGIALFLGTLGPWLVVAATAVLFDRVFIRPEERMLEDRFRGRFRDYRARVRKWL